MGHHKSVDLEVPETRKRRIRIEIQQYSTTPRREYKPSMGQAIKLRVDDQIEQSKMFNWLVAAMRERPWMTDDQRKAAAKT